MKRFIAAAAMALITATASAEEYTGVSFIDGSRAIDSIGDHHKQADAWAFCAAVYDITSALYKEEKPAVSRHLSELANGAEVAVTMTIVNSKLRTDMSAQEFDSLWEAAKLAGSERPKSKRTWIEAKMEMLPAEEVASDLAKTAEVCITNAPRQELHIAAWREFFTSGLLYAPDAGE